MGVQGLWHLLQPCARPTKLESLEGRRLAIDSSIWLYHFQMAMRDKEGRTLSNAHILGFLWRILKLIHYGIRPIFVFDGGAPVMKRQTLIGRRQRKAGAKDDHRRIAERLLNARLREAAVAHVAGGGSSSIANQVENSGDGQIESHGLGENTVYFDDLTGAGSSSKGNADSAWVDVADDGAISSARDKEAPEDSEAQKKKKRNDWHKDPYALPALERDINTMTASNSTATTKARGGGKRQDVRFATEGELRALLSSIGPTDLDLDSEFFRSLPSELQYELVGDMRAASRGTSYKRLQAMLSQSPTPIDFSRAQIAGLKTRNELTQKVLEVTDEIGDAHIKVPIRVAGARNREYVLVRNKGDEGGFALGVRDTGTSQDKAIAIDEDAASTTTTDEDVDKRLTDEEVELEEVRIEASPEKANAPVSVPSEFMKANPNDPLARKEVAKELLQRRARALAKEKAREQGITDEGEEMEEQLRRSKQGTGGSASTKALFRRGNAPSKERLTIDLESTENGEDDDDEDWEDVLNRHEAADLSRSLDELERQFDSTKDDRLEDDDGAELELEEVPIHTFGADDYSSFYGDSKSNTKPKAVEEHPMPSWLGSQAEEVPPSINGSKEKSVEKVGTPARSVKSTSSLGFRLQDREGEPESLDRRLLNKRQWDEEEEEEEEDDKVSTEQEASDIAASSKSSSPVLLSTAKATWDPKHNRVISISDSDISIDNDETEPVELRNSERKVHVITKRTERGNHRDGGGNEVKVVDFQDETIDASADLVDQPSEGRHKISSPERDPSQSTIASPHSATDSASQSHVVSEEQETLPALASEVNLTHPKTETPSSSRESTVDGTRQSDDPSSPLGRVRRAEIVSPSPSIVDVQEDLQEETGEVVSFDNISSLADETGAYSGMNMETNEPSEELLSEVESEEGESNEGRESEGEHSDYSNRGFGRDQSQSASPSPQPEVVLGPDGFPLPSAEELAAMDEEDEAELGEMANDQDEFVSFLSRAKGQGLNQIRKEVEDEVNKLRSEHATSRRTEGEVTLQMAKEIQFMLRLFGLPYITAPMEAEAQCAELIALKLADGIITDDSDVFLFGGTFIYKNMFNNKKYVECYKLSDLQHDLGMDRTKLVQLAYLLGSDYTEGLEGVGPVLAMEILSHFPGDDGLIKFREWWLKVQMGKDTVKETYDSTLKRLKRTLRNKVHLDMHWPDPNVIDAYFEPTVDNSKEPFQWGLPDLDSLRSFFKEYLRWDQEKTDHYLIPAIEAQNRRSKRQGTQSTLDRANFFDLQAGEGVFAGRQRPGYHSSRLQQIVNNFRASNSRKGEAKEGKRAKTGDDQVDIVSLSEEDDDEDEIVPEHSLGKEMGKKSRPVVRRKGGAAVVETNQKEEAGKGKASKAITRKGQTSKRKATEPAQADNVHDQEWRPAKAKRQSKAKQKTSGGTSLSQARNMSLDNISKLPPSRAETRTHRDIQQLPQSRASIILSDDDVESRLSEEE